MRQGGTPPSRKHASISLANDPMQVREIEEEVIGAVRAEGYPEAACFAVRLALEEAIYNAFRHGHRDLPPGEPIEVAWSIGPDAVRITVTDQGPGFDPGSVPDPTTEERLELPHGRGLMLMKAYMTEVRYSAKGNQVTMEYRRAQSAG